jgi:formate-dependent nitrite reductase cytochrome c552 subunit
MLVDLMSKNKLGSLELFNSKKVEVLNSIADLKGKVEESEAKENENLSKFKRENEVEIAKIKASVKDLEGKFNSIEFNQIKATAREMKEILSKIR